MIILIGAPIIGLVLLLIVNLLPNVNVYKHVYWSMDTIVPEFEDETLVDGYRATLTGNFTDCIMILHALYDHPGHSALEQSIIDRDAVIRVHPFVSITVGQRGEGELVDFESLAGTSLKGGKSDET